MNGVVGRIKIEMPASSGWLGFGRLRIGGDREGRFGRGQGALGQAPGLESDRREQGWNAGYRHLEQKRRLHIFATARR